MKICQNLKETNSQYLPSMYEKYILPRIKIVMESYLRILKNKFDLADFRFIKLAFLLNISIGHRGYSVPNGLFKVLRFEARDKNSGVFPKCFTEFSDKNICHYSKRARTCYIVPNGLFSLV